MNDLLAIVLTGVGATLITDAWGLARKALLSVPAPDYGMVGRWIGHMARGKFRHDRIAAAAPIIGERALGWGAHYAIGIAFAAGLIAITGAAWLSKPTLTPALVFGIGTVLPPFLLMQPGMGAGIAASRTPRPGSARLQSLINHAVFGLGLWLTAWAIAIAS